MGKDRRNALNKAINNYPDNKYFLWVEPEKNNLITENNIDKLIQGANEKKYDIVVPKRKYQTNLPEFQRWIENRANKKVYNNLLTKGIDTKEILDLRFGPKLFTRKGAKYFSEYKGKLDKWDGIIKPVINALKDGMSVGSIEVDYVYDETQVKNETNPLNRSIKKKDFNNMY